MQLRLATPSDHEAVGEVTVEAYGPFVGADGPESGYVDQLRDTATRAREAEVWVAEEDGALLGAVTLCPEGSPWRELSRPGEGEFRMLAVSPQAQGRGVGETLVRMVLDRFRADGCSGVVLCSLPAMTAAHRLYERLGFVRAPGLDWSPAPGVDLEAFRLTWRLDDEE